MAKVFYKPFGIIAGIIGGLFARRIFDVIWGWFDKEEPPGPTTRDVPTVKILGATALQAATFAATRAAVNRFGARTFEYLTGFWPGERKPDPEQPPKV